MQKRAAIDRTHGTSITRELDGRQAQPDACVPKGAWGRLEPGELVDGPGTAREPRHKVGNLRGGTGAADYLYEG